MKSSLSKVIQLLYLNLTKYNDDRNIVKDRDISILMSNIPRETTSFLEIQRVTQTNENYVVSVSQLIIIPTLNRENIIANCPVTKHLYPATPRETQ